MTAGETRRTLLFDTGSSVGALTHNLRALNVDPTAIEAIVLSHGHFDHTMGLNGLVETLQPLPPLVVHPDIWLRRRVATPGRDPWELPTVMWAPGTCSKQGRSELRVASVASSHPFASNSTARCG